MKLYLAYGMNTNHNEMARRCPAAKYIANVTLKDHQLVFRGVADVVPTPGKKVDCALWMITDACEAALDRLEGFPNFYVKKYVTTVIDGRRNRMMLYIMRKQDAKNQAPAYTGYHSCLLQGYSECGLPAEQIANAQKRAETCYKAGHGFVSRQRAKPIKRDASPRIAPQLPLSFGAQSTVPNYRREHGLFANLSNSLRPVRDDDDDERFNALFEKSQKGNK